MKAKILADFQICISVLLSFVLRVSLFFLQTVTIFFFSQRVLFYFIGKVFFRRTEAVTWRCSVLSISQNSISSSEVAERDL